MLHGFETGNPPEVIVCLTRDNRKNGHSWTIRVQYGCLTGTAFHSIDCDCARQLDYSLRHIAKKGPGAVLYFWQREANGAGLAEKIRMNAKRSKAQTTADTLTRTAGQILRLESVPTILRALRITGPIRLLTNNPAKIHALKAAGVDIGSVIPLKVSGHQLSPIGKSELRNKQKAFNHWSASSA